MIEVTAVPIIIAIVSCIIGVFIGLAMNKAKYRKRLREAQTLIKTNLEREREDLSNAVHGHMANVRKVLSDALEAHDQAADVVSKQLSQPIDVPKLEKLDAPTAVQEPTHGEAATKLDSSRATDEGRDDEMPNDLEETSSEDMSAEEDTESGELGVKTASEASESSDIESEGAIEEEDLHSGVKSAGESEGVLNGSKPHANP